MKLRNIIVSFFVALAASCNTPVVYSIALSNGSSDHLSFNGDSGAQVVHFKVSHQWAAEIEGNESTWISCTPVSGDAGDARLTVSVTPNGPDADRYGRIRIFCGDAQQYISVDQMASHALTFSVDDLEFERGGGTSSFVVSCNVDFALSCDADWVSVSRGSTKSMTDNEVSVSVSANRGFEPRTADIAITGANGLGGVVTVHQKSGRTTTFDESDIVFSVGVISDVHINSPGSMPSVKFSNLLAQLCTKAEVNDNDGLDAVLVAGDLIDNPNNTYLSEFKNRYEAQCDPVKIPLIYTVGNHDVPNYRWSVNSVADAAYMAKGLGDSYFLTDQDQQARTSMECRHCNVDGYNVLCMTPNGTQPVIYSPSALSWLDAKLAALTSEEPDKYILLITHPMISNTIYGSLLGESEEEGWAISSMGYWATSALTSVLDKYPQVVVFGGHLHFPLNDPRSQWQGKFTVMGCASTRYMALENGNYENMAGATTMQDKDEFSQGNFIQFDASGNMRLYRMDFYHSDVIGDPIDFEYPQSNGSHLHTCNHAEMSLANSSPSLDRLEVVDTKVGSVLNYTAKWNSAKDDVFAHHYVLSLYKDGSFVRKWKILSDFYKSAKIQGMKDEYTVSLGVLAPGSYSVSLVAFDSWGKQSNILSSDFKVDKSSDDSDVTGLYVDVDFDGGSVIDSKGHAKLENKGAPITLLSVSHAGKSGTLYGVALNGSQYLSGILPDIETTSVMTSFASKGFSVEAFYVDKSPGTAVHGIFCATEMGGWGLAARATGVPYFIVGDKAYNTYRNIDASSAASKTELTHLVGVYNYSSRTISIYVNGKLNGTNTIYGPFYPGTGDTFNRFIIGGDTKNTTVAGDFPPTNMVVVDAKIYSGALNASEVAAAYENAIKLITQ